MTKTFAYIKTLNLKITHRYYTHVQKQICITKCQYCDFAVFKKCQLASMVIVCITVNEQFCSALVDKFEKFMKDHVMKELVTRQLEEQPTSTHQMTEADDKHNRSTTWCICSVPEYERMI